MGRCCLITSIRWVCERHGVQIQLVHQEVHLRQSVGRFAIAASVWGVWNSGSCIAFLAVFKCSLQFFRCLWEFVWVCESLWVWDSVDFIVIFVLVHGGKAVTAQNWYPVLLADSGTFFSFLCRQAGVLVLDLAAERILPLSLVHWLVHACSFSDYSVSVDAGFGFTLWLFNIAMENPHFL